MDVYKLGFVLSQIMALMFLTYSVLRRNKYLKNRHIARVKLRLIQNSLLDAMSDDLGRYKENYNPIRLTLTELDQETVGMKEVLTMLGNPNESYAEKLLRKF